jgi:DNA-binding IscR family transcriptional regulator
VLGALGHVDLSRNLCKKFRGDSPACVHTKDCSIRPIWGLLTRYIFGFLDKINLEQLLQEEALVVEEVNRLGAKPQSLLTILRAQ